MDGENGKLVLVVGVGAGSAEAKALADAGCVVEFAGSMAEAAEKMRSSVYSEVLADPSTLAALGLPGGAREPPEEEDALHKWVSALQESEEMHRNLIERSNDGVVVLQDRLIKFVNPRFVELSGYSADTLLGTPFTDYLTPEEIATLYKRYQMRMAGEYVPAIYETQMTRSDGSKIQLEISAAIVSFHGRPADLVLIRDIRMRKKAEDYLERYRLLSESARDVILFVEMDGRIIEANRAAVETYGYSREEMLSLTISDLREEEHRVGVAETIERAQHEPILFEAIHRRRDGSTFPVEVSVSATVIQDRPVLLGIVRDITERRHTEAILESERRRATTLESIAEAGLSTIGLPELLNTMVERIAGAIGADSSCIFVFDEEAEVFEAHASYNVPGILGYRIKATEGFIGKVATERRPIYVADAEHDPLVIDPHSKRAKSLLGVPLIARGRVVGVARVQSLVTRRFTDDEVRLLQEIAYRVAMAIDNAKLYDELHRSRADVEAALEREQHFSLLMQRALLPAAPSVGEGYDVAVGHVPVFTGREIGGDFYDVFKGVGDRAGILIGDVSGKGLESAALAATTRSTVHAFVHETPSAGEALIRANSVLCSQKASAESFVTVFLVTLDLTTGKICYSSAGHPPAAILRADGNLEFLSFGNVPLGLVEDHSFRESLASLNPGDKLVLYTDGITESHSGVELFDTDGIQRTLVGHSDWSAAEAVDRLISAATEWADGKLRDDAVVVVVERRR